MLDQSNTGHSELIDYKKASAVVEEMIGTIKVLENLLFIANKAGLFEFKQRSISGDPAQFRTTRWNVILAAAESRLPGSQEALTELCQHYWYPLYAFARRRGSGPHDAQDLTQGFFLHLLEHSSLKHADPLKGKFRSFLLASFRNFLMNEADRARSLKRGGDREFGDRPNYDCFTGTADPCRGS
jgi:hypothetical protein